MNMLYDSIHDTTGKNTLYSIANNALKESTLPFFVVSKANFMELYHLQYHKRVYKRLAEKNVKQKGEIGL